MVLSNYYQLSSGIIVFSIFIGVFIMNFLLINIRLGLFCLNSLIVFLIYKNKKNN